MRIVRILAALLFPTSGHFAAGRHRRGALWVAAFLVATLLSPQISEIPLLVVWLASIVDTTLIKTAPEKRRVGPQFLAILVVACVGLVVRTTLQAAWSEAFKIPAGSMLPTLEVGDRIVVDKRARTPARGEVMTFKYPKEPEKTFVKRLIAISGDTIEIKDNVLILNGTPVPRTHIDGPCTYFDFLEDAGRWEKRQCDAWDETLDGHTYRVYFDRGAAPRSFRPVSVASDAYYVLGDLRDNSHDSRYWGTVPADHIRGTARRISFSYGPDRVRWDRFNRHIR